MPGMPSSIATFVGQSAEKVWERARAARILERQENGAPALLGRPAIDLARAASTGVEPPRIFVLPDIKRRNEITERRSMRARFRKPPLPPIASESDRTAKSDADAEKPASVIDPPVRALAVMLDCDLDTVRDMSPTLYAHILEAVNGFGRAQLKEPKSWAEVEQHFASCGGCATVLWGEPIRPMTQHEMEQANTEAMSSLKDTVWKYATFLRTIGESGKIRNTQSVHIESHIEPEPPIPEATAHWRPSRTKLVGPSKLPWQQGASKRLAKAKKEADRYVGAAEREYIGKCSVEVGEPMGPDGSLWFRKVEDEFVPMPVSRMLQEETIMAKTRKPKLWKERQYTRVHIIKPLRAHHLQSARQRADDGRPISSFMLTQPGDTLESSIADLSVPSSRTQSRASQLTPPLLRMLPESAAERAMTKAIAATASDDALSTASSNKETHHDTLVAADPRDSAYSERHQELKLENDRIKEENRRMKREFQKRKVKRVFGYDF